jgi:hypothetical protein
MRVMRVVTRLSCVSAALVWAGCGSDRDATVGDSAMLTQDAGGDSAPYGQQVIDRGIPLDLTRELTGRAQLARCGGAGP